MWEVDGGLRNPLMVFGFLAIEARDFYVFAMVDV